MRGGGGIVELMGQVARELAEGGELFSLLLDAGDFANPVEEGGNDALGHGGNGLKHLREEGLGDEERPEGRDGESLSAVAFHAGKGEHTGHLPGAANKQGHGSAVLAADMDFALEDEDHVQDRRAFFEEHIAGVGDKLLAVAGQPEAVFQGQAMKGDDAVEGFGDFIDRGGRGRRGDGWGEHEGTSGRDSFRIADFEGWLMREDSYHPRSQKRDLGHPADGRGLIPSQVSKARPGAPRAVRVDTGYSDSAGSGGGAADMCRRGMTPATASTTMAGSMGWR